MQFCTSAVLQPKFALFSCCKSVCWEAVWKDQSESHSTTQVAEIAMQAQFSQRVYILTSSAWGSYQYLSISTKIYRYLYISINGICTYLYMVDCPLPRLITRRDWLSIGYCWNWMVKNIKQNLQSLQSLWDFFVHIPYLKRCKADRSKNPVPIIIIIFCPSTRHFFHSKALESHVSHTLSQYLRDHVIINHTL